LTGHEFFSGRCFYLNGNGWWFFEILAWTSSHATLFGAINTFI